MWPAHVSFPIDHNLTDTQGDGSSLTLLLFQLRAMGNGAAVLYSINAVAVNV